MSRILILLCASSIAHADSKQVVVHSSRYVDGQTIHIANQGGAINNHTKITFEVQVFSSGKVIAGDLGERGTHDLYSQGHTSDDKTIWSTVWSGTWTMTNALMTLDLTQHSYKCTREKTWSNGPTQVKTCRAAPKKLVFACKLEKVELADWNGTAIVKTKVDAWVCSSVQSPGEGHDRWVLGRDRCIETSGGMTYSSCKP